MSGRLAIGIVCYPSLGGSGVIATELGAGLAARGHRVHVIASAPPLRALPASDRLHVHTVRMPDYPLFEHPPYEMALAAAIVEVSSAQRLDLVHAHYAVPHAASLHLARQVLGRGAPRGIVTLHGTDVTRVGLDASQRAVTRFAVAAADRITVPSEFLRRAAHRLLGLPASPPIEVIPNFVDTDHFAPPPRRDRTALAALFAGRDAGGPILFHVSNFRPVKRTADLAQVLALVRRRVPARLVAVGDGPEVEAARAAAGPLGLADHMCFLGKQADFAALLCHADAFVLPSESESFGVAALEALSAGVPVFGYRVGGLPEVVGEDAGRLVAPFDVAALAEAIVGALSDPAIRAALGAAARARALAHFRRDAALDRYEACYRQVLEEATP